MKKEIRCPSCKGVRVIISRFNHKRHSDCSLCKGKGKIKINEL